MNASRPGPAWADERTIVALVTDRGRSVPWRFSIDPDRGLPAGPPARTVPDDAACWALEVAPATERRPATISVIGTLAGRAMELMTVGPDDVRRPRFERRTVRVGLAGRPGPTGDAALDIVGPGGPIETWVASLPGAGRRRLPTVVDIHGGPLGAWAPAPSLEVGILVSRGYRVVLPNIRGSASYGGDWIRPQLGDWGGVDAADVHAVLDELIGRGLVDGSRLGLIGLSYGGFLVNWLIATSDRFRAAISENGVTNQVNAWANSDSGPSSVGRLVSATRCPGPMLRFGGSRRSLTSRTSGPPLLMFQGGGGPRCPAADNEQYFIAPILGREVEYILYPGESTTLRHDRRPDRREDG